MVLDLITPDEVKVHTDPEMIIEIPKYSVNTAKWKVCVKEYFQNCEKIAPRQQKKAAAILNYNTATTLYSAFVNSDELYLGMVGYHLQQAVELTMKYILDKYGIDYPKTHDLNQLIIIADNNQVDLHITEYIYLNAALLTNWEANTRYALNYMLEVSRVKDAITGVKDYIETVKETELND